jgi:hypothetical protein
MEGCIFLTNLMTYGCGMMAPPGVPQPVGNLGVPQSFSLGCFLQRHTTELASDVHRPCPPFAKAVISLGNIQILRYA